MKNIVWGFVSAATLAVFMISASQAASFEVLPIGWATAVSNDGNVVIGGARWSRTDGVTYFGDFGLPPGAGRVSSISANAVSADGAVAAGFISYGTVGGGGVFHEATRWPGGGIGGFPSPDGITRSQAYGISADGSVIVGNSSGTSGTAAFRWTSDDGMVGLGDLPGGPVHSRALGVSADGSVIVGTSSVDGAVEAFRWTSDDGMVGLGDLPGGRSYLGSIAQDVSADGSVIVGYGEGENASGTEAFRWTSDDGMVGLGHLPGCSQSWAYGVSDDGSVIVGECYTISNTTREGFVWTEADGMVSLVDLLLALNVAGIADWELTNVRGISADGQWLVGSGSGGAYLANIAVPIPAAFWLFGSAVGFLGWMKRRKTN
jgi:probable HAF family extracellular repeat protein